MRYYRPEKSYIDQAIVLTEFKDKNCFMINLTWIAFF